MERHTLKKNKVRRSCAILDWSPLSFLTFLLSKEETQCGTRTSVLSQYVIKFRIVGGLTSSDEFLWQATRFLQFWYNTALEFLSLSSSEQEDLSSSFSPWCTIAPTSFIWEPLIIIVYAECNFPSCEKTARLFPPFSSAILTPWKISLHYPPVALYIIYTHSSLLEREHNSPENNNVFITTFWYDSMRHCTFTEKEKSSCV